MDEQRKCAYRCMIYRATLDIRHVRWLHFGNPLTWRDSVNQVRRAGAIADWMHNLAKFSAFDFEGFDEVRFWDDFDSLYKPYRETDLEKYREIFHDVLSESELEIDEPA